jgi:hypothetical protein
MMYFVRSDFFDVSIQYIYGSEFPSLKNYTNKIALIYLRYPIIILSINE